MPDEKRIEEAFYRVFTGKEADIVIQWLVDRLSDNDPLTVVGANGTDPIFAAFRDGGRSAFAEILDRAGYRITYERKPDERTDERTDDSGTDLHNVLE